jgi:hypothetical protein
VSDQSRLVTVFFPVRNSSVVIEKLRMATLVSSGLGLLRAAIMPQLGKDASVSA